MVAPTYEGNPKHKDPWQPGRKGTLCPKELIDAAQQLLERSVVDGKTRFSTDGERAFQAHEHAPDLWHGHPVGWVEVPEKLRRTWVESKVVTRAMVKRYWNLDD